MASLAPSAKRLASALRTWLCPPISRQQAIASAELEREGDRANYNRGRADRWFGVWTVDFHCVGWDLWVTYRIDASTGRILSVTVPPR